MRILILIISLLIYSSCFAGQGILPYLPYKGSAAPTGISDDFSSDTSTNYTATVGGITVSSGVATGSTDYSENVVIHETTIGSTDHYVQADVQTGSSGGVSCVIFGASAASSSATGYVACPNVVTGYTKLYTFSGSAVADTTKYWTITTSAADTFFTLKVEKTGTSFELFKGPTSQGTISDSTYTGGQYVGVSLNRSSGYSKPADNFSAGAL